MRKRKLLLILGAGASKPYGFPTGPQLLREVQNTRLNQLFADISIELGLLVSELKSFQNDLLLSGLSSIDAFLENNPRYLKVGKLVIAYFLINYEDLGNLFNYSIEDNWYQYLVDKMLRNYPFTAMGANQISFITYNYDRSLEFYLYNSFKQSYEGLTDEECTKILSNFPIVHLHGSLGMSQFTDKKGGKPYTRDKSPSQLTRSADSIHIISERIEQYPEFTRAYDLIKEADDIIFLGFGYHPVNVERLRINDIIGERVTLWGSALGMAESEKQHLIAKQFRSSPGITLQSVTSLDFLRNHVDLLVE